MASDELFDPATDPAKKTNPAAKRSFNNAERFAVWRAYDGACFWCGEPLTFKATEVDHVIAESLAKEPEKYAGLLKALGLPEKYDVNDFPNWVPACRECNGRKGATTFNPVPMVLILLQTTQKVGEVARKYATEVLGDRAKSLLVARLAKAAEKGEVTADDLTEVGVNLLGNYSSMLQILKSRSEGLHLNDDWTVVQNYNDGTALVVGPKGSGRTVLGPNPDPRFKCEHCDQWGPWRGINCIQCGHSQVPDHGE